MSRRLSISRGAYDAGRRCLVDHVLNFHLLSVFWAMTRWKSDKPRGRFLILEKLLSVCPLKP
jgi:hypothetical protein